MPSTESAGTPGTGTPGTGTPDRAASPASPATPATPAKPAPATTTPSRPSRPPRARREPKGAWLGGVANGIATHLGWPVLLVRAGFIALTIPYFFGVFLYLLLWVLMPPAQPEPEAPGLAAATRSGMRPRGKGTGWTRDVGALLAMALLGAGAMWLSEVHGWGISQDIFWPLAFATCGIALVWRQVDHTPPPADAGGRRWAGRFVALGGWPALVRTVLGLALVAFAISLVAASRIGLAMLPTVLAMSALLLSGVLIVALPWLRGMQRSLVEVREEKVLADARADMAAHLHDSVLQTLALIQRQADDPRAVAALARRQERELRTWLYGDIANPTTLKAALTEAAVEVEAERGVPIEVVCVGDADLTVDLDAMVRAAREAMVNAAKHSDAPGIDVYAEAEDDVVTIYVRDRGRGFDLDSIGEDRLGVRQSIIARMERHGGTARIRSGSEGTEVTLEMTR